MKILLVANYYLMTLSLKLCKSDKWQTRFRLEVLSFGDKKRNNRLNVELTFNFSCESQIPCVWNISINKEIQNDFEKKMNNVNHFVKNAKNTEIKSYWKDAKKESLITDWQPWLDPVRTWIKISL